MFKVSVTISTLLLLVGSALADDGRPIAIGYKFNISESGSFWEKTLKEMGTKETAAMITAACAVFGIDCSEAAVAATAAIKNLVVKDDVNGEEHHGIIRAPVGYEICNAKIDWGHASIDGESTFNTVILRSPQDNGLGFYAVVPKHRKEGHWISATLYLQFVPAGKVSQSGCMPTGINPWICKGPNCNNFYQGARL